METAQIITHDNRKIYPDIYSVKPGPVQILRVPKMQYVTQEMSTTFHMNWAGRPEPLDEQWIVWKIVNQLKQITKKSIGYKFKLMPTEIIWHSINDDDKYNITHMMQVPDCITSEIYEEARANVEKNLRGQTVPKTKFVVEDSTISAQKLHVGHYQDTLLTLQEIENYTEEQGYRIKGNRREIYLTPAMQCHLPETWKTIVRVEIDKLD
ncbi:hypothetical protein [Paenibacillus radicis (ex Gao et al. 2016)]|uniref:GyrI-like small molecule binding domain-containing protein n=1 Tax=Paenibacillus radicis (ex Gao et al. 2016) TaxID=1737354 RepID=A0A917H5Y5_9BACL|nr:hypothetical protein [Paenibacillus radicis (ex Gao et al. 2016)]GGG68509.1 hypothetical protein GCM10010918_24310 [Paenibacillus radicis (ex Gao et al. 2016)]